MSGQPSAMSDAQLARERCDVFLRQETEVLTRNEVPLLEECPICLDTYTVEPPVRIKQEGCRHVFGRNCIIALLTSHPRQEKRCPLCRTTWMDASAPRQIRGQPRSAHPMIVGLPGSHWGRWRPAGPPSRRPTNSQPRVINLVDSDDAEEDVSLLPASLVNR